MQWQPGSPVRFTAGGYELEGRCFGPAPSEASTIVLLHEGLGCVDLWREFPERLAAATGHGVFVYSRAGYGQSQSVDLPRPLDYMTHEALDVVPDVLEAIGFRTGVLMGHSDGASIAAIYAGSVEDFRIRGLVLMAPHFFTEPAGLQAIAEARGAYETGDLKPRLAKYHRDPDNAFYGWNDAWLDPGFKNWNIEEVIAYFRIPVLAIQGAEDQYGSTAQIDAISNAIYSPLDIEILQGVKHSPQAEAPERTMEIVSEFVARLDRIEAAEVEIA